MPTHGPFEITIREHHQANQAFWWHPTRRPLDHHATTDERSALALGLRILRAQRREAHAQCRGCDVYLGWDESIQSDYCARCWYGDA